MVKEKINLIINPLLLIKGYKRKGNNWYKKGNGITSMLYLQRSSYSNQYYVSLHALFDKLLEHEKFPYHVSIRFESILGKEVTEIFNLDNNLSDEVRQEKIIKVINN